MSNLSLSVTTHQNIAPIPLHPEYQFIRGAWVVELGPGEQFELPETGGEIGLVGLSGAFAVAVDGNLLGTAEGRNSVYEGLPHGAYIPAGCSMRLTGGPARIGIYSGSGGQGIDPVFISPEDVKVMSVGKDNWRREVRLIIPPDGFSSNIVLGETINPPGNWSGTPAHKHEHDKYPDESLHEEIYYFEVNKPQGWGIQRVYSPERGVDEIVKIINGTVVHMPYGYHQVAAAPGYTLYYTFFLAGRGNRLIGCEDPDHSWIKEG